jgi:hypothetical protein
MSIVTFIHEGGKQLVSGVVIYIVFFLILRGIKILAKA